MRPADFVTWAVFATVLLISGSAKEKCSGNKFEKIVNVHAECREQGLLTKNSIRCFLKIIRLSQLDSYHANIFFSERSPLQYQRYSSDFFAHVLFVWTAAQELQLSEIFENYSIISSRRLFSYLYKVGLVINMNISYRIQYTHLRAVYNWAHTYQSSLSSGSQTLRGLITIVLQLDLNSQSDDLATPKSSMAWQGPLYYDDSQAYLFQVSILGLTAAEVKKGLILN